MSNCASFRTALSVIEDWLLVVANFWSGAIKASELADGLVVMRLSRPSTDHSLQRTASCDHVDRNYHVTLDFAQRILHFCFVPLVALLSEQ